MKTFSRVIIALDNTDFDEQVLSYVQRISKYIHFEKVYAIYVSRRLEIPAELGITYKDEHGKPIPKDEMLKKVLHQKTSEWLGHLQVHSEVLEGSALERILHWVEVKQADLLILGNKHVSEGSGVLAKKVARNTKCAVMFVPHTEKASFRHLLVPVDFSDFSALALQGAAEIAEGISGAHITAFHAFDVPTQSYVNIGTTYEAYVQNIEAYKREAFAKFKQPLAMRDVPLLEAYAENDPDNPARHIHHYAHNHEADLIVMAAQGHSLLDIILIGSVTEKLVTYNKDVPVLILRQPS